MRQIGALRAKTWKLLAKDLRLNLLHDASAPAWLDSMDETAEHWIIRNQNGRVVASGRMNICFPWNNLPYGENFSKLFNKSYVGKSVYFSRLVVDEAYRGMGFAKILLQNRIRSMQDQGISYGFGITLTPYSHNALLKFGFQELGYFYSTLPETSSYRIFKEDDRIKRFAMVLSP